MPAALAALIPVKSFAEGKTRLESALSDEERSALAEKLATAVIQACGDIPVYVACEDDEVAAWATSHGAHVIQSSTSGLNQAVRHGVACLHEEGFDRALVAHADLADPRSLPELTRWEGIVLVPDRRLDGTNVLIVPTHAGFTFSYGVGSFARHLSEAERMGLGLHIIEDDGLALDLDEPDDLRMLRASPPALEPRGPAER